MYLSPEFYYHYKPEKEKDYDFAYTIKNKILSKVYRKHKEY